MGSQDEEPITDQVTLGGVDAEIYEAIATLEFIGRSVRVTDIAAAADLDEDTVRVALDSMIRRGILVRIERQGQPTFEPAWRGWSTAPDQSAGPQL
jgi:predicted DNA-binding transcriptional regulator